MSRIWKGPGVLSAKKKGDKSLRPGDEVPKGFISSDRCRQFEAKGKIVDSSAYSSKKIKSGAAVSDSATQIRALGDANKELTDANKELTDANKELTDANKELTDKKADK